MQIKALVSEDGLLGIMACPSGTKYGTNGDGGNALECENLKRGPQSYL